MPFFHDAVGEAGGGADGEVLVGKMEADGVVGEGFGADRDLLELEPGDENGGGGDGEEVEVGCCVEDFPPAFVAFEAVLHGDEEEEVDPEEEDGGPASEAVHLFPHVVVAGAHFGEGEDEDVDEEDVEGYCDEEAAEPDALVCDVVLDSYDCDIEEEEPDDCGDAGARVYATKVVEFCNDPAKSQREALRSFAKGPEKKVDDMLVTYEHGDRYVRCHRC